MNDEIKLLLDYITNLQQENERLKETNVYCNRTDCIGRIKDSKKYDSVCQENERLKENLQQEKKDFKEANDYCFELKDYKSRCEKAIEYIKQNEFYLDYKTGACIKGVMPLLNILQNGSEDE